MSDDTPDLVQLASHGDDAAIGTLLERHLPRLRAFVRLRAGPVVRAQESHSDLVQTVCRRILEDADKFEYRGEASFLRWLYTAALNKIIERQKYYTRQKRDVRRQRAVPGNHALLDCYLTLSTPSRAAMQVEQIEAFETVFDALPEDYRAVITLSKIVGLSHAEIAVEMDRNEGAVRVLLHRALARLRSDARGGRRRRLTALMAPAPIDRERRYFSFGSSRSSRSFGCPTLGAAILPIDGSVPFAGRHPSPWSSTGSQTSSMSSTGSGVIAGAGAAVVASPGRTQPPSRKSRSDASTRRWTVWSRVF